MDTIASLKEELLALKKENQQLKLKEKLASVENFKQSEYLNSQTRFRTVFESSKLGNKIISSDLTILELNPALVELLGYDRKDELIGTKILDFSPIEQHQHWKLLQENLWNKSTPSFKLETCLRKKDGSLIWCNVNSILFEDNNETLGFTIIENITVKREIRVHKNEFINLASHELKTPLTSLKAVVQLFNKFIVKDSVIDDRAIGLAHDAERYIEKLNYLIDDLLNATSLGDGAMILEKKPTSLKNIIDSSCNHIRLNGFNRITHTGNHDINVFGDKHRIDQVLVNLLNNAVKFAPLSEEIIIHVDDLGDWVKVSIIDHGKGISAEYVPYLFDRYYSINENQGHSPGLGLGLFISAEIIRKHDGKIGVESEIGKGSTFWFILPKSMEVAKAAKFKG